MGHTTARAFLLPGTCSSIFQPEVRFRVNPLRPVTLVHMSMVVSAPIQQAGLVERGRDKEGLTGVNWEKKAEWGWGDAGRQGSS